MLKRLTFERLFLELDQAEREELEERAAIVEFCGGASRLEAEVAAAQWWRDRTEALTVIVRLKDTREPATADARRKR